MNKIIYRCSGENVCFKHAVILALTGSEIGTLMVKEANDPAPDSLVPCCECAGEKTYSKTLGYTGSRTDNLTGELAIVFNKIF